MGVPERRKPTPNRSGRIADGPKAYVPNFFAQRGQGRISRQYQTS